MRLTRRDMLGAFAAQTAILLAARRASGSTGNETTIGEETGFDPDAEESELWGVFEAHLGRCPGNLKPHPDTKSCRMRRRLRKQLEGAIESGGWPVLKDTVTEGVKLGAEISSIIAVEAEERCEEELPVEIFEVAAEILQENGHAAMRRALL